MNSTKRIAISMGWIAKNKLEMLKLTNWRRIRTVDNDGIWWRSADQKWGYDQPVVSDCWLQYGRSTVTSHPQYQRDFVQLSLKGSFCEERTMPKASQSCSQTESCRAVLKNPPYRLSARPCTVCSIYYCDSHRTFAHLFKNEWVKCQKPCFSPAFTPKKMCFGGTPSLSHPKSQTALICGLTPRMRWSWDLGLRDPPVEATCFYCGNQRKSALTKAKRISFRFLKNSK